MYSQHNSLPERRGKRTNKKGGRTEEEKRRGIIHDSESFEAGKGDRALGRRRESHGAQ